MLKWVGLGQQPCVTFKCLAYLLFVLHDQTILIHSFWYTVFSSIYSSIMSESVDKEKITTALQLLVGEAKNTHNFTWHQKLDHDTLVKALTIKDLCEISIPISVEVWNICCLLNFPEHFCNATPLNHVCFFSSGHWENQRCLQAIQVWCWPEQDCRPFSDASLGDFRFRNHLQDRHTSIIFDILCHQKFNGAS